MWRTGVVPWYCRPAAASASLVSLSRTSLWSMRSLTSRCASQQAAQGYVVQTAEECEAAIGLVGKATTMLRPAGRGRFGDENYLVVSRGEYIEKGTPIRIIQAEGNRYVVEKA